MGYIQLEVSHSSSYFSAYDILVSVFKGYEPNTIAVLAEDIAAVCGVLIAGTGIGLSAYTG